jgi:hypothetical protein
MEKGPGWSHSLHLIELFSDLINFLNFYSQGAAQKQFKSVAFFESGVVATNYIKLDYKYAVTIKVSNKVPIH